MNASIFENLFTLINNKWHKENNDPKKDWYDYASTLGPLGLCNICQKEFGPRNSHNLRWSKQFELIIEHGLDHYPNLKLFL